MRNSIEVARQIAKDRGGKCLSNTYKNNYTKMKWMCSKNHIWESTLRNIKNAKTWCPKCRYIGDYLQEAKNIAKIHNGVCLSNMCEKYTDILEWQCNNGHTWKARFHNIKICKQWCPECNHDSMRVGISIAKQIANSRNGKCLSNIYANAHTKLIWKCNCGYEWKATFNSVKRGSWCPKCKKISNAQKLLYEIINDIYTGYDIHINYNDFDWLKTSKHGKMEIDIFVCSKSSDFSLGIEYDGEQHFVPVTFGGISVSRANLNLLKVKNRDRVKNNLVKNNKNDINYFIRFNYTEKLDKEYVLLKLISNGIPVQEWS